MTKKNRTIFLISIILLIIIIIYFNNKDNENYAVAKIIKVTELESAAQVFGQNTQAYSVELKIISGKYKNKIVNTEHYITSSNKVTDLQLKPEDKVVISVFNENGELIIGIDDYYNTKKLIMILLIFIIAIVILTGKNGIKSLVSLGITLFLIFGFMTDLLLKGYSPIFLAIIFSFIYNFRIEYKKLFCNNRDIRRSYMRGIIRIFFSEIYETIRIYWT
jgi:uncharacterized membrane protein